MAFPSLDWEISGENIFGSSDGIGEFWGALMNIGLTDGDKGGEEVVKGEQVSGEEMKESRTSRLRCVA